LMAMTTPDRAQNAFNSLTSGPTGASPRWLG